MSTPGVYHGGYHEYSRVFSTLGGIMSTLGGYQDACGGLS